MLNKNIVQDKIYAIAKSVDSSSIKSDVSSDFFYGKDYDSMYVEYFFTCDKNHDELKKELSKKYNQKNLLDGVEFIIDNEFKILINNYFDGFIVEYDFRYSDIFGDDK